MQDKIISIVTEVVAHMDANDQRFKERLEHYEAEGLIVIRGGGQGDRDENGDWLPDEPYTNYRTGEVVENKGDEAGRYVHTDHIHHETYQLMAVDSMGLPESLAGAIEDWVYDNEQEARALLVKEPANDDAIVSSDDRSDLLDIDNPVWWVAISSAHDMGSDDLMLNRAQAEEYNKDPDAFSAKHIGITKQQYLDWVEHGPELQCVGTTKAGKRCQRGDLCMGGVKDWVEMSERYLCPSHRKARHGS